MKPLTSTQIKKLIKEEKIIIGSERTLKSLKLGKIGKVLLSSNCPAGVEKSVLHYSALSGAELIKLKYANEELGVICKKSFSISMMGVLKA